MDGAKPVVALFVLDGMWSHDIASAIQVFGGVMEPGGDEACDVHFVGFNNSAELDHGLSMRLEALDEYDETPDIVIVPGFSNPFLAGSYLLSEVGENRRVALCSWLGKQQANGAQIGALGTGVFVLAWAGVLDNSICTVHRNYVEQFECTFPQVETCPDRLICHDSRQGIWTSAGGASCIDMCLSMLMRTEGQAAVRRVANTMNLWSPRSLDTRQDSLGVPSLRSQELAGDDVRGLVAAVRHHLDHAWSISEMAWYVGMSPRTFQRHFMTVMGQTPNRWLVSERLAAACELLEQTDLPLSLVASRVGMNGADTLRKHFVIAFDETPSAYRRRHQQK